MKNNSENILIKKLAKSIGDFLLIFDKNIATFVEISQSKLAGGISTLIPFKDSGKTINLSLFSFLININILSKYKSKMFIK